MSETWIGITVSGSDITLVNLQFGNNDECVLNDDLTWSLQKGERAAAYAVMYSTVLNYLKENSIDKVVIKKSALSREGINQSHLDAAELRGVVMAAAAKSSCETRVISKAHASRTFGKRNTDEYVKDEIFWTDKSLVPKLRKGSREAAFLIFAARK
ncbi:hypothetical protein [Aggregatilinea lenta]|uniref:hypothetical protein n=1 Tax=Aggregatilinea lenta TaxID=913108 RepID=UPI000E5AC7CB|nr:hypothetical protein [Aggregatilinea lenta]